MLRVQTLGGLAVTHPGRELGRATVQPRRLALLAVLARAGERGVARERLLALFWPDDDERARRSLAQAVYALRRDLGDDAAIVGTHDLRLDPALVSSDVAEFAALAKRGRLEEAAALYAGPFLQGFHLPGADLFDRWVEEERQVLAREHARLLERLALAAEREGGPASAARWWRALAAADPLDARVAERLMTALEADGDRAGALKHARVYEALVRQELDIEPDAAVLALADRLRAAPPRPAAGSPPAIADGAASKTPVPAGGPATAPDGAPGPAPAPVGAQDAGSPEARAASAAAPVPRRRPGRLLAVAALGAALVAGAAALVRGRAGPPAAGPAAAGEASPTIAVGLIADFRTERGGAARPLADMLATNLARAEGVQIVSPARIHELLRQIGSPDTAVGAYVAAARQAGAAELVDGTLYARGDGSLRLDLRRVDIGSGAVRGALTVEGADLFAVADSGTARLLALLGAGAPPGSIADVSTRSEVAYRLYDQGVRAYFGRSPAGAVRLLDEALRADSGFAMAAYYRALALREMAGSDAVPALRLAARLADRAGARERLLIRTGLAAAERDAALRVLADSLRVHYPREVEGHYFAGYAMMIEGDYARARDPLERAVAMDSLGLRGSDARCTGCRALRELIFADLAVDSLAAAERTARRWVRLQPRDTDGWIHLALALGRRGRWEESEQAYATALALDAAFPPVRRFPYWRAMRSGALAEAERMARAGTDVGSEAQRAQAWWDLVLALRHQGRMREALEASRAYVRATERVHATLPDPGPVPRSHGIAEAATLLDDGRHAESARLFAHIGDAPQTREQSTYGVERWRAWMLTHAATADAALGDTAALRAHAATIRTIAAEQGMTSPLFGRYAAGLLAAARGDTARAIAELRASLTSPTMGYTRVNLTLARLLLRTGRADEAVAVLQPALRGEFEASNYYVTYTELHEAIAQAWEAVRAPAARDSAAAHWRFVAEAWRDGDPAFAARARAAMERQRAGTRN